MRKPDYAVYEQQRRRSACASAQSISAFVVRCMDNIIPLVCISVCISEISILYLASVAVQPGLCLTWSQTPKSGFLITGLNLNRSEKCYV